MAEYEAWFLGRLHDAHDRIELCIDRYRALALLRSARAREFDNVHAEELEKLPRQGTDEPLRTDWRERQKVPVAASGYLDVKETLCRRNGRRFS